MVQVSKGNFTKCSPTMLMRSLNVGDVAKVSQSQITSDSARGAAAALKRAGFGTYKINKGEYPWYFITRTA